MKLLFLILMTFEVHASCVFQDVSPSEMHDVRKALIDKTENRGLRVAINSMKSLNQEFGTGSVDKAVEIYNQSICKAIENDNILKNVKIEVMKTDFKGYYITCDPSAVCEKSNVLKDAIKGIKVKVFGADGTSSKINTSRVFADNYVEGYQKGRLKGIEAMMGDDIDIEKFLRNKMDKALEKLYGDTLKDRNFTIDNDEMKKIEAYIDDYRIGKISAIPKEYIDLIETLDQMEIPFADSNNFDVELKNALITDNDGVSSNQKNIGKGKYTIDIAKGGDDMILVVKENGQIVKVIGADAKGLGRLNISTRLLSYLSRNDTDSMYDVSERAMNNANTTMKDSMNTYVEKMEKALNSGNGEDIDQLIKRAFDDYHHDNISRGLMQMRTGAIDNCGGDTKRVKDRITDIHNTLKLMEKAGIDGHFGDSCIGVEYWSRKLGAKRITQKDVIDG